jgi:transcriptional regulator with XRE-family HTH domain
MGKKVERCANAIRERDEICDTIRREMKRMEYTFDEFAEVLHMSKSVLSQRLKGISEFRLIELIVICDLLGIEIII